MKLEDFNTDAYRAGVRAGDQYNADPTVAVYGALQNPYEYGSEDWQRWNLEWNYTVAERTPTVE